MNTIVKTTTELYRVFDMLNARYYDGQLPHPMITIQKSRANSLGHFTLYKAWKKTEGKDEEENSLYEININPVNLNRPTSGIVSTLHHEMVHYLNKLNDVKDCNSQKHNKKFKALAESVGLICEKSDKYGWGFTAPDDELLSYIEDVIKPDPEAFEYFRVGGVKKEAKPREKRTFEYRCPNCGLAVKAKINKAIKCGSCNVDLIMEK